jgi:uncharacterized protein YdiU (UPF0061 family)
VWRINASGRLEELRALALHALSREFPEQLTAADSIGGGVSSAERFQAQILGMARAAAERFAQLAANWVRVGYVQSNFNGMQQDLTYRCIIEYSQ